MTTEEATKPTIDERLATTPGKSLLIAAALAPRAVGRRLIMLHGEWDACAKPRRPLEHDIKAIYRELSPIPPRAFCISEAAMNDHYAREPKMRMDKAKLQAEAWYQNERLRVISRLKSLPSVRDGLEYAAQCRGIEHARAKVLSILAWWLDPTCPVCEGRRHLVAPGTSRLSNRTCRPSDKGGCGGTGERHLPHGADGRVIEALMIDYIHRARQQINALDRGYTAVQWKRREAL